MEVEGMSECVDRMIDQKPTRRYHWVRLPWKLGRFDLCNRIEVAVLCPQVQRSPIPRWERPAHKVMQSRPCSKGRHPRKGRANLDDFSLGRAEDWGW